MTKRRPRWVVPFLRALARTGQARAAALDAGIDFTTAYARRKAHPEFAGQWLAALRMQEEWMAIQEREKVARLRY